MRRVSRHRSSRARVAASCLALLGTGAMAQAPSVAPSQVTPPSVRPDAPHAPSRALVVPHEPLPDDAPEAALDVRVGQVRVEGGLPAMEGATRALLQPLQGRRATLGQIRRQVAALEDAYRNAGYFLVRITLPPQRLQDDGALRVVVLDGFIERVDTATVPERVRKAVQRSLQPLVGRRGLLLSEAERRLRIAGGLAGLRLHAALSAGDEPGGARLLVEGELQDVSVGLTVDNGLDASLGRTEALLSVSLNSPFGEGERLYAALGTAAHAGGWATAEAPLALAGVGAVVPLGIDGWSLNPEFTQTTLNPEPPPGGLRLRGRLSRTTLRLGSPAFAHRAMGGAAQAVLEHVSQRQATPEFGLTLSEDRYDALRLGFDGNAALGADGTAVWGWLQWSQGLGGRTPAPAAAGPALSRQGASPRFSHLNAAWRWSQPLWTRTDLTVAAAAQHAFGDPQLVSEQFALSAPDRVSGRAAGSLAVDQGMAWRAELSWSLPAVVGQGTSATMAAPYLFHAGGHGRLLQPTAVEQASVSAHSAGLGLRASTLGLTGSQAQVAAELARCWGAPGDDRRWRLWLRLSVFM